MNNNFTHPIKHTHADRISPSLPADEIAIVAFGSNLGDSEQILNGAIAALDKIGTVIKVSPWYQTKAIGPEQPDYLNGCLLLHFKESSTTLMRSLLTIEAQFHRTRTIRWGPRTLDLDLISRGSEVLNTDFLTLPHPRMHERAFVLTPLSDISPDWIHPILHQSVSQLLQRVGRDKILKIR